MTQPRRIGIFGGTFDPVHIGHLRAAHDVAEQHALSRVILVPNRIPPHKRADAAASPAERLHMVRLAIEGDRRFEAGDFELRRVGPSYTLETLRHFRARFGAGCDLFFILGADAFAEIATWHEAETVLAMADFVVMTRAGAALPKLGSVLPRRLAREFTRETGGEGRSAWRHASGRRVLPTEVTRLDISASDIRRRVAAGLSIRHLVPEPVRRYILRKRLYR